MVVMLGVGCLFELLLLFFLCVVVEVGVWCLVWGEWVSGVGSWRLLVVVCEVWGFLLVRGGKGWKGRKKRLRGVW